MTADLEDLEPEEIIEVLITPLAERVQSKLEETQALAKLVDTQEKELISLRTEVAMLKQRISDLEKSRGVDQLPAVPTVKADNGEIAVVPEPGVAYKDWPER